MSYCFRKNTKNRDEMIRSEYDKKYNVAFNPVAKEHKDVERNNYEGKYETPIFQITPYNQKNQNNIYYKFNNTI